LSVAALTLMAACGSDSGSVSQPEDEFLDKVEALCVTAERDADKLDLSGDGSDAIADYVEIITVAHDDIEDLDPPASLKKDFTNLVGDLDDQITQGKRLVSAIDGGDQAEIGDQIAALVELTTETDNAAKALGALQCRRIAPDVNLIGLGTDASIPDQTVPVDTTPDSTLDTTVDTTPATTLDTTAETTPDTTIDTVVSRFSTDLSAVDLAPEGYTWVTDFTQTNVDELYSTTVLGPLVTGYEAGQLVNDGGGTASIFVITLTTPWAEDSIGQWLFWERLDEGTEAVTPAGRTVMVMPGAFDNTDCLGFYEASYGIAVCTFAGEDGKPILDAYIATNPR